MTTQNLPSTRRLVAHDNALAAESRLFLGFSRHPRMVAALALAPAANAQIDPVRRDLGRGRVRTAARRSYAAYGVWLLLPQSTAVPRSRYRGESRGRSMPPPSQRLNILPAAIGAQFASAPPCHRLSRSAADRVSLTAHRPTATCDLEHPRRLAFSQTAQNAKDVERLRSRPRRYADLW